MLDEAQLERRLTKLEAADDTAARLAVVAVEAATQLATARHGQVLDKISTVDGKIDSVDKKVGAVDDKVARQNGRVGKLETWRTQVSTLYAGLLAIAPFVFYALLRVFGE